VVPGHLTCPPGQRVRYQKGDCHGTSVYGVRSWMLEDAVNEADSAHRHETGKKAAQHVGVLYYDVPI
jgi:hypothetical protein